ncbi:hypothetical protein [Oceanibium sediminis]|uniref:hypothetical protein n=1 Tax=Oceanibium sediminis TaxID=2026339 RepID=UPI000DD3F71D|nr:hypothetical protein [Oceanibium sediminis]
MTALEQYIRLEAAGRWREGPDAPWREVLVSFGNASLVLSDFEEQPLTHWSLAAVEVVAREGEAVVYAPDPGASELLEVSDAQMVEAIAAVSAMARTRAAPAGRRRALGRTLTAALVLGLVAFGALRGPDLLRARAFALVSSEQAELMSDGLRPRLATECRGSEGMRVLARLADHVAPGQRVEVRRRTSPPLGALPDGTLILGNDVVEQAASPAVIAGWIALGAEAGPALSPFYRWTQELPARELLAFLSSGEVGQQGMREMVLHARATDWVPEGQAIALAMARLAELGVRPDSFAADVLKRLDARPSDMAGLEPTEDAPPLIRRDRDWLALLDICGG